MGEARKAVARPRAKSAAAKAVKKRTEARGPAEAPTPTQNPWDGLLDTGDEFSYGASMEVKVGGKTFWPKAHATVHKRPGESEEQTASRAAKLVHEALNAIVAEFIKG
jgi:hypothetical protein